MTPARNKVSKVRSIPNLVLCGRLPGRGGGRFARCYDVMMLMLPQPCINATTPQRYLMVSLAFNDWQLKTSAILCGANTNLKSWRAKGWAARNRQECPAAQNIKEPSKHLTRPHQAPKNAASSNRSHGWRFYTSKYLISQKQDARQAKKNSNKKCLSLIHIWRCRRRG